MLPFTKTLSEPAEFVGVPVVLAKPAATFLPNLPISNKFKHGFVADDSSPKAINRLLC